MPGTRHAKNNTALGYFTRHEREQLGWGSQKKRLSKESIKQFYACSICLKLCNNPLICPNGDLFCKECIYQSLLTQKRKNKQKLNEYNQQQQLNQHKIQTEQRKNTVDKFLEFDKLQNPSNTENKIHSKSIITNPKSVLTTPNPHDKQLSCFWIPSLTPNAGPLLLKSPDMNTYCPGCNKPLKRKQLVTVKFTLSVQDDDIKNKINGKNEMNDKNKNKKKGNKMISSDMSLGNNKEDNLFECGSCSK
eukprot:1006548_1